MLRRRFFGSALLIVAMLVASATPALAGIQVRAGGRRTYTFSRGKARGRLRGLHRLRDGLGSAVSRDTDDDIELRHRTVTKITEFQCWGDDDITIPFRGLHPGLATIDATLTACDAENLTDCATTRS